MMPEDFKPPTHVETHAYVFDRKTGEILATHTRWTEKGASPPDAPVSRELLTSIAGAAGRAVKDVDVLSAKARASRTPLRVDVATRKIVSARAGRGGDLEGPGAIGKP